MKYSKLTLFFLTVITRVASLFWGKADKVVENPKRILTIYLTGNIGDMIFGTPVFRALKEAKSDSEIFVVGKKHNKETLSYNSDIHEYVVCPDSPLKLWKEIRRIKPDYAFLLTQSPLELALMYLGGVPAICVFETENTSTQSSSFRSLKKLAIQVPFESSANFVEQNMKLLKPLSIETDVFDKHLYFSNEGKRTIEAFYKENGIDPKNDFVIAIAPGAGTKIKQWPADRFAKLADHLYAIHKTPIFIVGGPGDVEEFEEMKNALNKDTKIVSCLHHNIDELKAFMSMINLIVANDSAPIYIGEAFHKATVVIVGPTDENEHPPKGDLHRTVKNRGYDTPALVSARSASYSYTEKRAREQIERVTVLQVTETTDELISYIKGKEA